MSKIAVMGFLLLLAAPAYALNVTACGTTIARGEIGDLQADLVCGPTETGVILDQGATLRMHGHSISGGDNGIGCLAHCRIEGPGEIFATGDGVVTGYKKAVIHELNVHDTGSGIGSPVNGDLDLVDVTVSNVVGGFALRGGKMRATNVTVTNSGDPVFGAVYAVRGFKGSNIDASGNAEYGLYSNGKVDVTGLVATGNSEEGIQAKSVRLVDSTVTGNDAGGDGVDIRSKARPRLIGTTCGKSRQRFPGDPAATWGVCAGD